MKHILFSQKLKNTPVNIQREYERLYDLFYIQKLQDDYIPSPTLLGAYEPLTLRKYCAANFLHLPFRGTCISLDDFDECHGYTFKREPADFDIDYLVTFCEYSYNLTFYNQAVNSYGFPAFAIGQQINQQAKLYVKQVLKVIESIGYMPNSKDGITTDFVPKDQVAITVAKIINDPILSYKTIEYNHHSTKGDLEQKRGFLLSLANELEPQREKLKQINSTLESDIFLILNNLNIRHNNTNPEGSMYKPSIAKMSKKKMEQWYDDVYQMCMLAFLELKHIDRKDRIKQLREDIKNKA